MSDLHTIISQFVIAATKCIINALDLKIFPNNTMLLKVDHFEGFGLRLMNWWSIVWVDVTKKCKLNNNNYKLDNNLAWKQCSLLFRTQIPFTYSYLSTKFGVFPMKFKGDMHDSLKHVLTLCYHSYSELKLRVYGVYEAYLVKIFWKIVYLLTS